MTPRAPVAAQALQFRRGEKPLASRRSCNDTALRLQFTACPWYTTSCGLPPVELGTDAAR